MTAVLAAQGLGKRYGRTWALSDCTLEIPEGHVVGLVGPNGAGKSTLLNLAVGLLSPTSGEIEVLGSRPASDEGQLGRVGFVAQDTPTFSGAERAAIISVSALISTRAGIMGWPIARIDRLGLRSIIVRASSRAASGPSSPSRWPSPSGPSC